MDVLFYEDLERLYDVETAVVIGSGAFADVSVIFSIFTFYVTNTDPKHRPL